MGTIAPEGQAEIQVPQSTHNSSDMTALPFRILIDWVGHCRTQAMWPRHFSGITL